MMHKRENEKEIKKQPYLKHTALYFQLRFSNGFSVRILRALPDLKEKNRRNIFREIFS